MAQSLMLPEHDSFSHKKSIIVQYSLAAHKMPRQLHSHALLGLIYFKMLLFLCSLGNGDIRKEELVALNILLLLQEKVLMLEKYKAHCAWLQNVCLPIEYMMLFEPETRSGTSNQS